MPKTIALCMICHNEAGHVTRLLSEFSIAFDTLCLVRAIGSASPDDTVKRAEAWCAENRKGFKFAEYQNRIVGDPWVDDFSAARNLSFGLADTDWLLWADWDDTIDALNAARLRDAADRFSGDALLCSYTGAGEESNLRERLVRNGTAHWHNPIHETMALTGEISKCQEIVIRHLDHGHKNEASARRNASILQRAVEHAPRHYFYLHSDLKMLGDTAGAERAARAAIELLPPTSHEERYLVLLNLAQLDPAQRQHWLLRAASEQPHRREAFAYLCQHALVEDRVSDATAYYRLLCALPVPHPTPWTHQAVWYGVGEKWLRQRVLRARGQTELAEKEREALKADAPFMEFIAQHGD